MLAPPSLPHLATNELPQPQLDAALGLALICGRQGAQAATQYVVPVAADRTAAPPALLNVCTLGDDGQRCRRCPHTAPKPP